MRGTTTFIQVLNKVAFACFALLAAATVAVTCLPQKKELRRLDELLDDAGKREQLSLQENDRATRELSALQSDPNYLEIIARDRLDLQKEGEQIIRIERK